MPSIISAGTTAGTAIAIAGDTTGNLAFQTNGTTTAMTIDTSQNVGVGTTTINDRLVVQSSSAEQGITIRGDNLNALKIAMVNPGTNNDGVIGMKIANALRFITDNTERMRITSGGDLQFNSGYGSVATAYGCRAWVNFNGNTSPGTIRASGNVTSVTKNGTGDYTVNLTTAMPDVNYCAVVSGNGPGIDNFARILSVPFSATPTTSSIRLRCANSGETLQDLLYGYVAIFR